MPTYHASTATTIHRKIGDFNCIHKTIIIAFRGDHTHDQQHLTCDVIQLAWHKNYFVSLPPLYHCCVSKSCFDRVSSLLLPSSRHSLQPAIRQLERTWVGRNLYNHIDSKLLHRKVWKVQHAKVMVVWDLLPQNNLRNFTPSNMEWVSIATKGTDLHIWKKSIPPPPLRNRTPFYEHPPA